MDTRGESGRISCSEIVEIEALELSSIGPDKYIYYSDRASIIHASHDERVTASALPPGHAWNLTLTTGGRFAGMDHPEPSGYSRISHILETLNLAQLKAVKHRPDVPLQILAGPGSGKTKVLTSRIAHLILDHSIPPSAICAVTFTNKAANEMRERLWKLIGKPNTTAVKLGTFHALCALFLRKYSRVVGLESNFTVCDADESKKIIAKLLKPYKKELEAKQITLKEGTVMSLISKAKAKGLSAADMVTASRKKLREDPTRISSMIESIVADIYVDYEKVLRRNNSLDFDDLLLYGLKLFSSHRKSVDWCKHVLVDEFQDTNITQYELMRCLAIARCVTVVGDPDQSIYGWRSAEVGNLSKMQKAFPTTKQIFLEQNYRSTGSILAASLAIVAQDKSRIPKSLHTAHPPGITPVLRSFHSEAAEADFIASEVKRLVAFNGGVLNWGDFVVLLRFNALSRSIENSLQKEGIPSRVLGGHKFFERLEVKDLLAYLQLVDNPSFLPGFMRVVNVPARGIGEKTVTEIIGRADRAATSPMALVEKIHDGDTPDIKPAVRRKVGPFVTTIRKLRALAAGGSSPPDLIRALIGLVKYEDHLKKTQQDWKSRWENVQELITFASDVNIDTVKLEGESNDTPLRLFLQASMLSSEGDNKSEEDNKERVTISTCHAAKGLEWPVVMVPAVEEGVFPFYRTEDVEEERRLLYVACTRAQGILYLSYTTSRKVGGVSKDNDVSQFIDIVTKLNPIMFTPQLSEFDSNERSVICKVLDRQPASAEEVARRVAEYNRIMRSRDRQPANPYPDVTIPAIPNLPPHFMASGALLGQGGQGLFGQFVVGGVARQVAIQQEPMIKQERGIKQERAIKQELGIKREPIIKRELDIKQEAIVKLEPGMKAGPTVKREAGIKQESGIKLDAGVKQEAGVKREPGIMSQRRVKKERREEPSRSASAFEGLPFPVAGPSSGNRPPAPPSLEQMINGASFGYGSFLPGAFAAPTFPGMGQMLQPPVAARPLTTNTVNTPFARQRPLVERVPLDESPVTPVSSYAAPKKPKATSQVKSGIHDAKISSSPRSVATGKKVAKLSRKPSVISIDSDTDGNEESAVDADQPEVIIVDEELSPKALSEVASKSATQTKNVPPVISMLSPSVPLLPVPKREPQQKSLGATAPNIHKEPPDAPSPVPALAPVAGVKRRLGMGRSTVGYSNKKFKPPT